MSKGRRVSPGGTRSPAASLKQPRINLLQAAADIVSALPDAVVVTGLDRRVLAVNQAAADLFGWQAADLVGQAISDQVAAVERAHVAEQEDRSLPANRSATKPRS